MTIANFLSRVRLVWSLSMHEILTQRKESFLGLVWPLLQACGLLVAFSLIRGDEIGVDRILSSYIGVLIWTTGATVLTSSLRILVANREVITHLVFPFSMLCVVDVTVKYVFFLIQLCIVSTLWFLLGPHEYWYLTLAYLAIYLVAFYLFLLAMAWIASVFGVALPDLSFLLPPVLVLLLALSPVFQRNVETMPWALRVFNESNPLSISVEVMFSTFGVMTGVPEAPVLFLAVSCVVVVGAWLVVGVFYREIPKVI